MVSANAVPTKLVGNIFSNDNEKAEFARIIRVYSDRKVAAAAAVSEETARLWKTERRFPHGQNLMKLMAEFPKVHAWVSRRTGGMANPQSQAELFAMLESNTPLGRAMRARACQLAAEAKS